jgi:hypothetical protein
MITNRKEFVNSFDYTLFDDYIIKKNEYKTVITQPHGNGYFFKYYNDLIIIIVENYEIKFDKQFHYNTPIKGGFNIINENYKGEYLNNVLQLEFPRYYPSIFSTYYLENKINYNEESFLLYALLNQYRAHVKKNIPILNDISKILLVGYFGYLTKYNYICENNAFDFSQFIFNKLENYCFYADTDSFYFKDINEDILEILLTKIGVNFEYEITPLKYFYIERIKDYSYFFKDVDGQYKTRHRGHFKRPIDRRPATEKTFLKNFRKEKIEKLLSI